MILEFSSIWIGATASHKQFLGRSQQLQKPHIFGGGVGTIGSLSLYSGGAGWPRSCVIQTKGYPSLFRAVLAAVRSRVESWGCMFVREELFPRADSDPGSHFVNYVSTPCVLCN